MQQSPAPSPGTRPPALALSQSLPHSLTHVQSQRSQVFTQRSHVSTQRSRVSGSVSGSVSGGGSLGSYSQRSRRQLDAATPQKTRMRNGVNILRLQEWRSEQKQQRLSEEECQQEMALAQMKKQVNANSMVVRLQSWARMLARRKEFRVVLSEKANFKWMFFYAWYAYTRAEFLYRRHILARPLREWQNEASEARRLSELALSIFKKAVNSSKLTPQAVMAFFSKNDSWGGKITEQEMNMVRRLILQKLYAAWVQEAKLLRIRRFKASQIITRMLRRTFGNLSQKERLILSMHLWHRLAAVSAAERRGDPQPFFNQPYIKEWPIVLQNLTVKKIKKIRAQESSRQLLKMRGFKAWCMALSSDNSPDNEDSNALAEAHFVEHLLQRVFDEWNGLARERGRNLRRREKCFFAWARWAPEHRRLTAAERVISNWDRQTKTGTHFGKWSSAMHGIVAARTFSLRILRQKIFSTPILTVCYTLLGRGSHLMLLHCWRRWKSYWSKRKNWLRARWKFRVTWIHERCQLMFNAWREHVKKIKAQKQEIASIDAMGVSVYRRNALVRQATCSDFVTSSEKEATRDEYEKSLGFANHKLLAKCFAVMNNGAEGKLELLPDRREFMTLMKVIWERPSEPRPPPQTATSTYRGEEKEKEDTSPDEDKKCDKNSSEESPTKISMNRPLDEESEVFAAVAALNMKKLAQCVLDKKEIQPELIERFSVGLGDKYVPLVSMLLAKCTQYMAKRILVGDLKDQIMKCNSPLMALLIGTHITRWDNLQLTTREVKSVTEDVTLSRKSGSTFQFTFIIRTLTLVLLKQRCRDLINACAVDPGKKSYTEEEGVALVLRRKKLHKLWRTEEVMRDLLGLSPDPVLEDEKEQLKAQYAEYYVGKVQTQVVKVKEKAHDPWIFNLDLGSLLREYAHLTGSLADTAKDMRQPLLQRDDRLLKNGLLKQARKDYQELKAYTQSLRPKRQKRAKMGVRQKKKLPPKKKKIKKLDDEEDENEGAEEEDCEVEGGAEEQEQQDQEGHDDWSQTFGDGEESDDNSVTSKKPIIDPLTGEILTVDSGGEDSVKRFERQELGRGVSGGSSQDEEDDGEDRSVNCSREGSSIATVPDGPRLEAITTAGGHFELHPDVVMESWWPTLPKPVPPLPPNRSGKYSESARAIIKAQENRDDTHDNIVRRMLASSRSTVARIVAVLEQLGLPSLAVRQPSDYCREKSGISVDKETELRIYMPTPTMVNVGANFIEAIHNKPYRIMQLKQWKSWWPRKWWQHERLSHAIEAEILDVQVISNRTQDALSKVQVRYKEIDKEVHDYTKYMNQMRRRMVAIGGKTKEHDHEAGIQRSALKRLLDTARVTNKKKQKALNAHISLVAQAKIKYEEKKWEDVCAMLKDATADDESVAEQLGALSDLSVGDEEEAAHAQNLAYRGMAKELLSKLDKHTAKLTDSLLAHDIKLKKAEVEFEAFCGQTDHVKAMFGHVAKEKFSSTLEVQDLAVKRLATLKGLRTEEDEHKKVIKALSRYCDELMAYSDHLVCVKEKEATPPSPIDNRPLLANVGRSATSGIPRKPSPARANISKMYSLHVDNKGSPVMRPDNDQIEVGHGQFNPPAPRGHTPLTAGKTVDFSEGVDEEGLLSTADDELDLTLSQNVNTKTLDFLSGGKRSSNMTLTNFSKKISEEDQFSLNRQHSSKVNTIVHNLETAEKEVKISDELARSIRVEITDEYWNILEMMESQGEKNAKPVQEDDSSMTSSLVESASVANASNVTEDLMFFDEEDLEEFPLLNRKLSRTARMYHRVKQRCLLNDSDGMSWPEVIEEELEAELAALQKEEDEARVVPGMNRSRRLDIIFEINKRKGVIKRTLKKHHQKEEVVKVHAAIDPYSGEMKQITRENLMSDPTGENIEKVDEDQWSSSDKFRQASISMSANDPSNKATAPKKPGLSFPDGDSMKKVRQRAALTKRRKAVVKVVLMDPFASAASKLGPRMQYNAKDEVVKPLEIDDTDKFTVLQPEQVAWRKDLGELKYELSELEEPRMAASSPEEARAWRDAALRERREREEREIAEEEEALRRMEKEMAGELDILDELEAGLDGTNTSSQMTAAEEKEPDAAFDFDTLFANGLIDEEEYDRLKIIRAADEKRKAEEAEEEEARKEAERMLRRKEREDKLQAQRQEGLDAVQRGEEAKKIKLQDENQLQTVTAMIEAKKAQRSVEQHTIYDKKELEEIKRVNILKEKERRDIINRGIPGDIADGIPDIIIEPPDPTDIKTDDESKAEMTLEVNSDEENDEQVRSRLEKEIDMGTPIKPISAKELDIETDNFWGAGVDLGHGPQLLSDDDSSVSRSTKLSLVSGGKSLVQSSSIEESGECEGEGEGVIVVTDKSLSHSVAGDILTAGQITDQLWSGTSPPVVQGSSHRGAISPHGSVATNFSDEDLRIVSTIDTSPVLSVVRGADVSVLVEDCSPGNRSQASAVSDLSHDSVRRQSSISGKNLQHEKDQLEKSAEQYLPEYFANDDHSVLSINSQSSKQIRHEPDDFEPEEGQAIQLKNDVWKIVPLRRAILSPEASTAPRESRSGVIFGTKIVPAFDEDKILKRDERAARAQARIMERSLSRSPSPSRRPIVAEDDAGGKWLVASPVRKVHVMSSPHKVNQPIEVVGSNPNLDEPPLRVSTASDEKAPAAVYNPKRWQNKFFNGQGVVDVPVFDDSLSTASQLPGEQVDAPSRKVPVLSNVRPAPIPPPQNSLKDLINRNINADTDPVQPDESKVENVEQQEAETESDQQHTRLESNQCTSRSYKVPILRAYSSGNSCESETENLPNTDTIDLDTEEYEYTPSAREFLTCEEGISKPSRLWLEEQARKRDAREYQQQLELCGDRVDRCVDNVVRVLLEDTAQNAYHEENVTQRRVRVHNYDRAKQTLYLKQQAEERRMGLVPVSKKETVAVRGEYSEDLPLNGSLEGQSVAAAFQTLNEESFKQLQGEMRAEIQQNINHLESKNPTQISGNVEVEGVDNNGEDNAFTSSLHSNDSSTAFAYLQNFSSQDIVDSVTRPPPVTPMNDDLPPLSASNEPEFHNNSTDTSVLKSHSQRPVNQLKRSKTPKDKFKNLQSENLLPFSESAPTLSVAMDMAPQVIGLAPDAVSKQKKKKLILKATAANSGKQLIRPTANQSVENMNLQNFDFAFSSHHAPSHDDLLSKYDPVLVANSNSIGREKIHRSRMEVSHSAPLFPPLSAPSRPSSNDSTGGGKAGQSLLKAKQLAERIMESKEDTQRQSPLGNGKPFDDAALYVTYGGGSGRSLLPPSAGKGPPPVGGGAKGKHKGMMGMGLGKGIGKGSVMKSLSGGGSPPMLAGLRKLSSTSGNSLLSQQSQADPIHDSNDVVMAAYAAAMGIHWDSSKGGANVSTADRLALHDLLAAVEESRSRAPLFTQEDVPTPMDSLLPTGLSGGNSYPEVTAPLGIPPDPRSSAGVRVDMSDQDSENDDEDNSPQQITINVRAVSTQDQQHRGDEEEDDDDDDDEDEEAILEAELRAMLERQKRPARGKKVSLAKDLEQGTKHSLKVGNRQHFGSTSSSDKLSEYDGLPSLVVGAAGIPRRKPKQPRRRPYQQEHQHVGGPISDGDSTALTLNSCNSPDTSRSGGLSARSQGNMSAKSTGRSSVEMNKANSLTPAAQALLAKYGPANNPQLAASLKGESKIKGKGTSKGKNSAVSRRSSGKKTLSTLESHDLGLDASSLLERTMADYEGEE